jgi:hypothetical protein
MKQKLLLALLALFTLGGSNLFAQTDVTATYLTNADFEGEYTQLYTINTDRYIYQPNGWTVDYKNVSTWNMTVVGSKDAMASNFTGTYAVPEDNHKYMVRFRDNQTSEYVDLSQTITVKESGTYTFSADLIRENGSKINVELYAGEQKVSNANPGTWENRNFSIDLEADTEIKVGIKFSNLGADGVKAGADNVKIMFTPFIRPTGIALNPTTLTLTRTGKSTLEVTYTPSDANKDKEITWTTSDESVATVADGVVTAVAAGTATITATTANGKEATCEVTVNEAPLANGDYYIMNVAKTQYLGGANSWGSQASILDHGIPFYAELDNGAYKLNSRTYNSDSQHFFTGTYVDGDATSIYITSLGNGKYSISTSNGSAFLTANNENTVVANTATDATSELAQWKFVTRNELVAALDNATSSSPVDATFYIGDPNFSRNYWPAGRNVSSWKHTTTNQNLKGGNNDNMCAETYRNNGGKIYQELNVPNGMYVVKCQGFFRQDEGSEESYLYANDEKVALCKFNANNEGTEGSMASASTSFSNGYYKNELTVFVSNGSLTVGIQGQGGNWTCFDNFELYYYGPTIGGEAVELANPMEAGKWYYFDLDVDGTYNLTANTLSDIVYTNDGTVLIENEGTVTTQFAGAENQSLTAGRYYVKSSSEQTFTIAPASYDYSLGEAVLSTADGGFTQSSTFTVTFPNAATNDPVTALALVENGKATVNGAEVALTAAEKGFTFELGTIAANTDFVIAIPAAVYGYADHIMNEAINITIHTPAVFDGEYVLYDATSKLFLGRGAAYGTEAIVDKYGIPFALATDATGVSSFKFVDNDQYLFSNNSGVAAGMFTDAASTGWTIIAATDGYILKDANGDVYAKVDNGSLGLYAHTVEGSENATVWTFKTKAERDAIIAAYPTDNINNVINASCVSTTADAFETYLSENYKAVDYTDAIGTATFAGAVGDWTWSSTWRNQDGQPAYGTGFVEAWNATGAWSQTISKDNLPAGIYKVTVQGYERRKANDAATSLYNAGYNLVSTFLSANDEQVRFTDWNDVAGKPTNTAGAVTAFTNGEAINEVYVYLDGNTDLTLTVKKPNYIWDCWVIMNNFTLTRYAEAVSITIKAERQYTAFSYDKPLDFTDSELTAEIVTSAIGTTQTVTKVPANTGIIVGLAQATTEAKTISVPVCVDETDDVTGNMLVAVLEATTIPQTVGGYTNYVFGKSGGKEQFFKVRAAGMEVPANNAYLKISNAEAKGLDVIGFGEDATGISAIEKAGMQNGDIYNLQGQKVNRAQKGVYIVNGKKVILK